MAHTFGQRNKIKISKWKQVSHNVAQADLKLAFGGGCLFVCSLAYSFLSCFVSFTLHTPVPLIPHPLISALRHCYFPPKIIHIHTEIKQTENILSWKLCMFHGIPLSIYLHLQLFTAVNHCWPGTVLALVSDAADITSMLYRAWL